LGESSITTCVVSATISRRLGIVRLTAEDVMRLFMRHNPLMRTSVSLYHRHRFRAEIVSHCVWLYFRFALSFRDVEELMFSRGVCLTYQTVWEWSLKFGQTYANGLRRRSPRPGDQWHLDEVLLKINGRLNYLWRAVDQDGRRIGHPGPESQRQERRQEVLPQVVKGAAICPPQVLITDKGDSDRMSPPSSSGQLTIASVLST
jgi:transposase-like protein